MSYIISPKGYHQFRTDSIEDARLYLKRLDIRGLGQNGWGTFGPEGLPVRVQGNIKKLQLSFPKANAKQSKPIPVKRDPVAAAAKAASAHARLMAGEAIPAWRPNGKNT
jgi:hypothetical protein